MRKLIILLVIIIFHKGICQDLPFKFPSSPDGSTFINYFNQILTNSTGNPNIEIPLYMIEISGEKIPISLNYVGSAGIKVDEIASRVGLGWRLNIGGGSIEKTIVGREDSNRPKLKNNYDYGGCTHSSDWDFLHNLVSGENDPFFPHPNAVGLDMRPDIFNYSLLKRSGKFIYDHQKKAQKIPYTDDIISDFISNSSSISILDEDGVKYEFRPTIVSIAFELAYGDGPQFGSSYKPTEIEFPNSEKIIYRYEKSFDYKQYTAISQSEFSNDNRQNPVCNSLPRHSGSAYGSRNIENVITEIDFGEGKILFDYNEIYREDLLGDKSLKRIRIINKNDETIKDYLLNYNYFLSNESSDLAFEEYRTGDNTKRLKLASVTETISNSGYYFDYYYDEPLPARFSSSIDAWGLSNGKKNGTSRVGSYIENNHYYYSNRSFDESYAKSGLLKKITYPTKGYIQFEFEPDDYYFNDSEDEYTEPLNAEHIYIDDDESLFIDTQSGQTISKSFIVDSQDFDFRGSFQSDYVPSYQSVEECRLTVSSPGTQNITVRDNIPFVLDLLSNKTYTFTVNNQSPDPNRCYVTFQHRHKTSKYVLNKQVGSFRIKKIEQNDGANSYIKEFEYKKNDSTRSSGILMDEEITFRQVENQWIKNNLKQPVHCGRKYSSNDSKFEINSHYGKPISYERITEKNKSNNHIIKSESYYKNESIGNELFNSDKVKPKQIESYKNGVLYKKINYRDNEKLSQTYFENDYDYHFNQYSNDYTGFFGFQEISNGLNVNYRTVLICIFESEGPPIYGATFNNVDYPIYSAWVKPVKEINSQYFNNGNDSISVTKNYYYSISSLHTKPINIIKTFLNGNSFESKFQYAHEKGNTYLTSKNMIGIPLETEVIKKKDSSDSGTTISKSETVYPYSQSEADSKTSGLPLPISVSNLNVQTNAMSTEVIYKKYDDKGNFLQYNLKPNATEDSGNPVSIIWGYNKTQPIAKIEGAAYDQVSGYISEIVEASEKDSNPDLYNLTPEQSEQNLIDKLDEFRKKTELSGFQITTYTYDPLIGVKSITPPSGIREVYYYDTANRLQSVKDIEGKILKEYQYNYKH